MTLCLFEILAPGVKPMAAQDKTVNGRTMAQRRLNDSSQSGHVLIVLDNRQPFAVAVRFDSFKSLQHLVAFYPKPTAIGVTIRNNNAPYRMCMQYGASMPHICQKQVQCGFSGRTARSLDRRSVRINVYKTPR